MRIEPLNGSPRTARRHRAGWSALGIGIAVVLVLGGLVLVAAILLYVVALGNIGSNK